MKALIVHNSDEVKACFFAATDIELVKKIMSSEFADNIKKRVGKRKREEEVVAAYNMTIEDITDLYNDEIYEDGYTLLEAI